MQVGLTSGSREATAGGETDSGIPSVLSKCPIQAARLCHRVVANGIATDLGPVLVRSRLDGNADAITTLGGQRG